jgi:hypothetical protein
MPATLSYTYPNALNPSLIVPLPDYSKSFRFGKNPKLRGLLGEEMPGVDQFSIQNDEHVWFLKNLKIKGLTYTREGDKDCCTLVPIDSTVVVSKGDSINFKFFTLGSIVHKFTFTVAGEEGSKKRHVKPEDTESEGDEPEVKKQAVEPVGAAATGAADGAGASATEGSKPVTAPTGGSPPAAATVGARLKPSPAVAARAQARVDAQEEFQAAGEAALPGSNWGNIRPAIRMARFDQAAIDVKERVDDFRRRRVQMEADLLGGAPGGSLEQPTQPTNMDVGDTQPVMVDVSETQPVVVDQRYAVLTVIKVPSDVGVRLHSSYVLEGDYSIGRLLDCDMVLRDPNGQFSRKAIVVKDNGDAGVTVEIHGTNGVIVKSVDGKATTYPGIVPGSEPKKVQVRFGEEFSIPRGGCDLSDVGNHPTFKVTKPV